MKAKFRLLKTVRYLLLTLLVAVILQSCDFPTQYVQLNKNKPFIVIDKIHLYSGDKLGKYKYFGHDSSGSIAIYLDERLSIGDTIWIGGNNR